jgi:hypothetical protein
MRCRSFFVVLLMCGAFSVPLGCGGDDDDGTVPLAMTFTGKVCGLKDACSGAAPDPCTQYGACIVSATPKVCPIVLNSSSECRTGEAAPCMTIATATSPAREGVYVCNACKWNPNMCKPCGRSGEPCCLNASRCTAATDKCGGSSMYASTGVCGA